MLSDSLELNGIAVLWASDLLQTGFRVADVFMGMQRQKSKVVASKEVTPRQFS